MVTSAKGAEQFYSIEDHATRKEGLDEARERDTRAAEAWIGHPYVDIIDNSRYVLYAEHNTTAYSTIIATF
jgi:hypothetical protein